jgi:hypothetical protein
MRRLSNILVGLTVLLLGLSVSYAQGLQTKQDDAKKAGEGFPVHVLGGTTLSTSAVIDDDPANEIGAVYFGRATYALDRFTFFLSAAVFQSFTLQDEPTCGDLRVADPASCRGAGDDALPSEPDFQVSRNNQFELSDLGLGVATQTPIKLDDDLSVGIRHELAVFAPTSWTSRHRNMYLALRYRTRFMMPKLVKGLSLLALTRASYRFHQYAETIGAAPITQLDLGGRLAADYSVFASETFGSFGVGASFGTQYLRRYEMCADKAMPDVDIEGTCGYAIDPTRWRQQWDWEAHLNYSALGWLSTGLSIGHGEPVLRNGVRNVDFFDRNRTRISLTLMGAY